jgi:hypothetical protein
MRELNWKPDQSVQLTVLGDASAAASARILDVSGKRMRLAAEMSLKPGAAVRLDWDGQLVLGEVLQSEPSGFSIEIHHMLLDTAGLSWHQQGWQSS